MAYLIHKNNRRAKIGFVRLGTIDYEQAQSLQDKISAYLTDSRGDRDLSGVILFLEHLPTITYGRNVQINYLENEALSPSAIQPQALVTKPIASLERSGITVVQSSRGGNITAHNPGQLVIYPLLPIRLFAKGVKDYVFLMEQVIINVLRDYDILTTRHPKFPGVWLKNKSKKIAALGFKISRGFSSHGLAINICNNLDIFNKILPCGIKDAGVTSIAKEWEDMSSEHIPPDVNEVIKKFIDEFMQHAYKFKAPGDSNENSGQSLALTGNSLSRLELRNLECIELSKEELLNKLNGEQGLFSP